MIKRFFVALLLTLACSGAAWAAESFIWAAGTTGWVKGNLTLYWYVDGVSTAEPGVTFTEDSTTGNYLVAGMPDAVASASTIYTLVWLDPDGNLWRYEYPQRTRTPTTIAWEFQYGIVAGTNVLTVGDTLPSLQVNVTGVNSDPTGATVTFSMWCNGSATATVDGAAASISNITLVGSTYSATLQYDWSAADTAAAGECAGRFNLDLGGGNVMTLPPRKTVAITIVP